MSVKIGDVVVYKPTEEEKDFMRDVNNCNVADELPAFVVAVWSEDCINIKVMYDGAVDDLWKTSVPEGYSEGQWHMHIPDGSILWNGNSGSLVVQSGTSQMPLLGDTTIGINNDGIYSAGSVHVTERYLDENGTLTNN